MLLPFTTAAGPLLQARNHIPPSSITAPDLAVTAIIFPTLSVITVVLRLITRTFISKNRKGDDVAISMAAVLIIGYAVAIGIALINGLGYHVGERPNVHPTTIFKAFYAVTVLYNVTLGFVKVSALMQYHRMCKNDMLARVFCQAGMMFFVAFAIYQSITTVFGCNPINFSWDKSVRNGDCIGRTIVWYTNSSLNMFANSTLLLLPVFIVHRRGRKMSKWRTVGFAICMACGVMACTSTIFRLRAIAACLHRNDLIRDGVALIFWANLEIQLGIIGPSLATLEPLLARFFRRYRLCGQHGADDCDHDNDNDHDGSQPKWATPVPEKQSQRSSRHESIPGLEWQGVGAGEGR